VTLQRARERESKKAVEMTVKIFSNLFFVLVLALGDVRGASIKCEKTVTTASLSGFKKSSSEKKVCSGDLIFEETFDSFDLDVWQHDLTFNGDDVRL
jgi:hypothetical protein